MSFLNGRSLAALIPHKTVFEPVIQLRAIIIITGWLLLWLLPAEGSPVYPVKIGSNNSRILVDQNNVPFLMVGDSPQSLVANLSISDASFYITDRAQHGFNTLLVDIICTTETGGRTNASLLDGTLPFTNTLSGGYYDLTAPNPAYFSYVDEIVNLCASNGIQVMFDPIETHGWLNTILANGTASCRAYGQYLGNRYKFFPNILWSNGNDFQDWATPTNDAVVTAVALGIRDTDTNHLQTIELAYFLSSSLDDTNWASIVGLNAAYTYSPTYAEVLHAYNQSSAMPTFLIEANYENETNPGTDGGSTRNLRMQEYWTMLSGASGQLYGNRYTVRFPSGWQNYLDTAGVDQLVYMENLFGSRDWSDLVPDQTHTFVTGDYGEPTNGISGNGFGQGTNVLFAGNDYMTSARTPNGSLGMAYLPQGGTINIAMTNLQNNITARWFDPTANTFTTIPGSPFSNTGTQNFASPGNNSAGDPDWVLVLEKIGSRPLLRIFPAATNTAVVAWPGYVLQQNADLTATNWVKAVNAITVVSNQYQVLISSLAGQEFYRLESGFGTPPLSIFLTATNTAVVTWSGYVLQQNSNLITTNWTNVTNAITLVSNEYEVIISPLIGQQFYRLMDH